MFRTSRPATARAFYDRKKELAELRTAVERLLHGEPTWVAIVGPRKVGKTSLILELERTVAGPVAFVVLDAENERPLSLELFRTYALRASDALLRPELPQSLEVSARAGHDYLPVLLASERARALPADVLQVLQVLPSHAMDPAFVRLCLDLPERLAHALSRYAIVAFDEFQDISLVWGKHHTDLLPVMRSAWQKHQRVAYVVSGSGRSMLEAMVTREHSPFFQHFSLMELERFAAEDAAAMLVDASPEERCIPADLARAAVEIVGMHPFYVQLLGEEIVRREPPYDARTLKESLQELLFSRSGRLGLYFQCAYDRIVGSSSFLAAALASLARGPKRVTDVAADLGVRSGDAARYLERLGDAVVKNDDGTYRLEDSTFGLWVAWKQPGGTAIPMTLVGDAAEKEVAQWLARLGFDLVYQSRASRGSFDLLALRGSEQLGIQVKRSDLPLRFDRPIWNRMGADAKRFGWAWIVAAVDSRGEVTPLDPTRARRGKEVRLGRSAVIENLSDWLQRRPR